MNLYYFISSKINQSGRGSFTNLVAKIAVGSVAIGLLAMIISYSILDGFRRTIREKIFSFSGHIQITKYDENRSYEESPVSTNSQIYRHRELVPGIKHIQVFSLKPGLLKTEDEVMGVMLKGVSKDFDKKNFNQNLKEGTFPNLSDTSFSTEILISRRIGNKLNLHPGDSVLIYFVQNPPRLRKLKVTGIYETGLEEFDEQVIIGDLRLNQHMNNWADSLVGGFEIFIDDFKNIDQVSDEVYDAMEFELQLEKITDKYIQIFDWLGLLNRNVAIFLVLILFVACFNMISTLFIMIMERTNMIGVLKSVGATNGQIRRIFLMNGLNILVKGMVIGNIIGLGFCAIQYYFNVIPLDPANYYMDTVPIYWNWPVIALINAVTFLLIFVVVLIPLIVISNISPIKSIKFD